jgi:hypothetical protein
LAFAWAALGWIETQGYWKNHAEAWSVSSLVLGSVTNAKQNLLNIL